MVDNVGSPVAGLTGSAERQTLLILEKSIFPFYQRNHQTEASQTDLGPILALYPVI